MLFNSIAFLIIFLPIVLGLYHIAPRRIKNVLLLLASLFFYAWGEPIYLFLMLLSILVNYFSGLDIYLKRKNKRRAKNSLIIAIIANLAILGFFKYYGFMVMILNTIFPFEIPVRELPLPIGISFYTFQALSYLIDIYRQKVEAQKNIFKFGLYISMFPQLVAGPIVRYIDIEEQLTNRIYSFDKFAKGLMLFIIGLAKKVLIADSAGTLFAQISALGAENVSVLTAWLGVFAFAFQIYFDFSGYSDMAIGLGKMLGFELPVNFDYPYVATSIKEFWQRWHITLSTWFREYVYIPLGGSRAAVSRHIINLLIVWSLTGLWHGAAWNFVIWGLFYGIALILEKYIWGNLIEKLPKILRHFYALFLIMIGWVFFFSPSLGEAFRYLQMLFGVGVNGLVDSRSIFLILSNWLLLSVAILGSSPIGYKILRSIVGAFNHRVARKCSICVIYLGIFILSLAFLITETYIPFLYFRF
ncbi:MAG: MBOAT family protein [Lachnospiraceae bacterium]|nr:MBOAT family protein [Lachnospiraceae bacterium]